MVSMQNSKPAQNENRANRAGQKLLWPDEARWWSSRPYYGASALSALYYPTLVTQRPDFNTNAKNCVKKMGNCFASVKRKEEDL